MADFTACENDSMEPRTVNAAFNDLIESVKVGRWCRFLLRGARAAVASCEHICSVFMEAATLGHPIVA